MQRRGVILVSAHYGNWELAAARIVHAGYRVNVVARDADDLYRIAGRILDIDGVEKTTTGLVMRQLVDYRLTPLLEKIE